jgi:hypothetical protein
MAKVTLTIEDTDNGGFKVSQDFGSWYPEGNDWAAKATIAQIFALACIAYAKHFAKFFGMDAIKKKKKK